MKKRIIYFAIFLLGMILFSKFVSAQEKVTFGVDSAYFFDKSGKSTAQDSFKVIFTGTHL